METVTINSFRGEYHFLSNFHPAEVALDDEQYPTVEHAFQAAKTTDLCHRMAIRTASTPAQARQLGRSSLIYPTMRPDWNKVRVDVMSDLLRQKFSIPECRDKLLATGDAVLIEGNNWNDTYWGVCNGAGKNMLGILLMVVRGELKEAEKTWRVGLARDVDARFNSFRQNRMQSLDREVRRMVED